MTRIKFMEFVRNKYISKINKINDLKNVRRLERKKIENIINQKIDE